MVVQNIVNFWQSKQYTLKLLSQKKNLGHRYTYRFSPRNKLTRGFSRLNPLMDYMSKYRSQELFLATDFNYYPSNKQYPNTISILYDTHAFDAKERMNPWLKKSFKNLKDHQHHLAISQYTKNSFIHTLNIDPEKITVIPLAHDTQNYNTVPAILNRDSQKSLKIDWNIPYLLYVGGSNENKNLKRLFLSLHEVIYRHQLQINLVLVGREHFYKKDNIQLIKKLNIESNIQMTGYLPDNIIKYLYQQAEAFIFPSIKEGFGIPLLEAMACGCPVICSNTTSLLEIGQDAVEYINPMETDSMVTTILKIYQNKSLKDELSAKGILHSSQYGWDITCRLIDQTLTNIFK